MEPEQPVVKHISEWMDELEQSEQARKTVLTNGGTLEGWEGWTYDPINGGYLTDPDDTYDIPMSRCRTAIDCADWLAHMTQKIWMDNAMLGGLVRAMQDLVGLRTEGHSA